MLTLSNIVKLVVFFFCSIFEFCLKYSKCCQCDEPRWKNKAGQVFNVIQSYLGALVLPVSYSDTVQTVVEQTKTVCHTVEPNSDFSGLLSTICICNLNCCESWLRTSITVELHVKSFKWKTQSAPVKCKTIFDDSILNSVFCILYLLSHTYFWSNHICRISITNSITSVNLQLLKIKTLTSVSL